MYNFIDNKKPKNEKLNDLTTDILDHIVESCDTISKGKNTKGSVYMNLLLLELYTTEIRRLYKLDFLYGEYEFKENRQSREIPLPSNFWEKLNEITEEHMRRTNNDK